MPRDLLVIVPGIMGSELLDAKGNAIWSLGGRSLVRALRTLGGSLRALRLPAGIADGPASDGVRPGRLIPGLHVIPGLWSPVAGYGGLLKFLLSDRFHLLQRDEHNPDVLPNLLSFAYDWRLSSRHNGRVLKQAASRALEQWRSQPGMEDAKLVFVCHSMGGLVTRWFVEREGGAEITRAVITIGTPHRGSLNALDTLANGLDPLGLGLTDLVRSLPSMYELLPTYDCLVTADGTRTSLAETPVNGVSTQMLADARTMHDALASTATRDYALHKIVGIRQPTSTTARVTESGVVALADIDGRYQGGDGTVPRLAAEPELGRGSEVVEVADQHGELQGAQAALDLVDGIVTREDVIWQAGDAETFGVEMDTVWSPLQPPELRVPDLEDRRLFVTVFDEADERVGEPVAIEPDGRVTLQPLPPGGYRAQVASSKRGGPNPVTVPFLVWDAPIRQPSAP